MTVAASTFRILRTASERTSNAAAAGLRRRRRAGTGRRLDTELMTVSAKRPDAAPLWLFGDQLGPHVWDTAEFAGREIVLVESSRALGRRRYHRQKLHLLLSGMLHLADALGEPLGGHVARPLAVPAARLLERAGG